MPMVFPTSPTVGQVFSSGGRSWVWTGTTWDSPRTDNLQNLPSLSGGNTFTGVQNFTTPIAVGSGGTGANTLSSGGYLKGAGTSAITSQSGIPAGDVISGTLDQARMPAGSILQVINIDNVTRTSQGFSGGSFINISGLEATISPRRSNSRIVITARWFGEINPSSLVYNSIFGVTRNGSQIGRQPDPGVTVPTGITTASINYDLEDQNSTAEAMSLFIADSPGTTSATTYRITFLSTGAGTLFTNRVVGWANQTGGFELGTSSLMLMEVAV